MRIGIDASRSVAQRPTGVEHYSFQVIQALLRLEQPHEYFLYFNEPPAEGVFPPNERVHPVILPFPRLWTHWRLATHLWGNRPDVLFVPSHVLPLIHPGSSVVTVHDLGFFAQRRTYLFGEWLYLFLMTGYSALRAKKVIADSEATKQDLVRRYGVRAEKIAVVPLGVEESFRPVPEEEAAAVARRYRLGESFILFVGTLQPRKNVTRLIQAMALLVQEGKRPPTLALVGKGSWASPQFFRWVERLKVEGYVRFLGFVPRDDLPALLSRCAVFVYPSLYEGFGLPVLEAMACGAPVITSNVSSLPEVAGDAAVLIDPLNLGELADAIWALWGDSAKREALRQRGVARAAQFTWNRTARGVLAVLEEAASGRLLPHSTTS
ncbi:MAG: glycosyltransferase family 4 protein [Chloroflexi bacterium]|nr:glycosyltransferase family 4 protein [Chloroflexota bacterium]